MSASTPRRSTRSIIALVVALVGLVWIGQGLGVIRGSSFMVDDIRWAIIGLGFVVAGAGPRLAGAAPDEEPSLTRGRGDGDRPPGGLV